MPLRKNHSDILPDSLVDVAINAKGFQKDNGLVLLTDAIGQQITITYRDIIYLKSIVDPYRGADCDGNPTTPEFCAMTPEEIADYNAHFANSK